MHRIILAAVLPALAIALFPPARVAAEPVAHLAWDECGAAGIVTRTFACNTNLGTENLVVSFVPPPGVEAFTGIEVRIRFWPPPAALPPWWALNPGGCRSTGLRSSPFPGGSTACTSPWTSEMFWAAELSVADQELKGIADLNKGQEHGLDPAVEYYGMRFSFTHEKSTGTGACDGCAMPVGMYLSRFRILIGSTDPTYEYALAPAPYVNWQCDGSPILDGSGHVVGWSFPDCATPTRDRTWGGIKSLYR